MNILIPPIVNMPRVCDECPEDLCLIGYTPPCPSQCYDNINISMHLPMLFSSIINF